MVRNLQFSLRQYARPVGALVSRVSIQMLCRMGGQESNKHARKKLHAGRGTVDKAVVVGMKDRESNQIRARVVENDDAETLQGFVLDNTTENTEVYTDGSKAYRGVPRPHMAVRHSVGEYGRDLAHTNGLERFAGSRDLLKWDAVPALLGPAHDTPFIPSLPEPMSAITGQTLSDPAREKSNGTILASPLFRYRASVPYRCICPSRCRTFTEPIDRFRNQFAFLFIAGRYPNRQEVLSLSFSSPFPQQMIHAIFHTVLRPKGQTRTAPHAPTSCRFRPNSS